MISNNLSKYLYFVLEIIINYKNVKQIDKVLHGMHYENVEVEQDYFNIFIFSKTYSIKIWKFRVHDSKDKSKRQIESFCFKNNLQILNRLNLKGTFLYYGDTNINKLYDKQAIQKYTELVQNEFGSPCFLCAFDFFVFAINGCEHIFTFCLHNDSLVSLLKKYLKI
jgi:hypothetical protein